MMLNNIIMDKTEQILKSLKSSLDPITNKAQSVATATDSPFASTLDFMSSLALSLFNNPLFYLKFLTVIGLTILIVMVIIGLITDG